VNGTIYANIWQSYRIAMISPATGAVTGWIDLEGLAIIAGGDTKQKVLNGIAYDHADDRLFVTGKLWPRIFEIKIVTSE
jgi:glutamine cyclotransferase